MTNYIYKIMSIAAVCLKYFKEYSINAMLLPFKSNTYEQKDFLYFFLGEIRSSQLKESTKHNHLTTLHLLQGFKSTLRFNELTFDFLMQFESYLYQKGLHINTVGKHMRHLKQYTNQAERKNLLPHQQNPFRNYRIKSTGSHHSFLDPDELQALENLKRDNISCRLQKSLDAFLFCCYTGLRYSDFTHLAAHNIVKLGQQHWLIYKSVKTNVEARLPLDLLFNGKAVAILNKHQTDAESFFKLKDNSNLNKDLQMLAQMAGIQKHISFHTARHTNATILIYKGVNITTVQKLLGHKSIKTTELYLEVMDMTLVKDLQKCFAADGTL